MRVFLTGATGHVGSAVLDGLVRAGFSLTALVRSLETAERLIARGVTPQLGNLASSATFAGVAESCDVVVHAGYEQSKRGPEIDKNAISVLMGAAARRVARGLPTTLVYTSAMWVLGDTSAPADETTPAKPTPYVAWRTGHEQLVLDLARSAGVRAAIVRPGLLYGRPRGIIGDLLRDASNGLVRVVGDGANHWPCVYDRDLADLYVRLAGDGGASGVFHATDEADECVGDIVEAIARHLPVRPDVRHMPLDEARTKLGPYADALALDQIVRSGRARALGWAPTLHSVAGNAARLLEEFRTARDAAA
jgi:nucleoside-diphosphate-sugar epimerase